MTVILLSTCSTKRNVYDYLRVCAHSIMCAFLRPYVSGSAQQSVSGLIEADSAEWEE